MKTTKQIKFSYTTIHNIDCYPEFVRIDEVSDKTVKYSILESVEKEDDWFYIEPTETVEKTGEAELKHSAKLGDYFVAGKLIVSISYDRDYNEEELYSHVID